MTAPTPSLSVVVPAFNEAAAIARYATELLAPLRALGQPFEVVIVDDGSQDDTAALAADLGPEVRLVAHPRNLGLAAAVQTGIQHARGELVVTLDADLTFSPTLIAALLARYEQGDVDVVSGSPKLAGFSDDIPRWRVWVSRAAGQVYARLLRQQITAVSPIFRLYRRDQLLEVLPVRAKGFEINAELLFELVRRGRRVAEIPAPLGLRQAGESRLSYRREIPRNLRLVGRMLRWRVGLSPDAR